jgi:hypothetical protein
MNGSPSFAPREFLDSLKRGEVRRPIVLYGMVKPAEDDDEYLLFAQGAVCANWVRIPLTSIESVEFLNFVPCNDHTHPLVVLYLKQPETDEGRLLASLFPATSARMHGRAPTLIRRPGSSPGRRATMIGGPSSFGPRRTFADPNAGIEPDPRWPFCNSLPYIQWDPDGVPECLDWCWESAHTALWSTSACG